MNVTFNSTHAHPESPLTGSTLSSMIKRAKELDRKYFAYTDNGHASSTLKAYGLAKDAGLKLIPGIEIYFKDNKCSIISGTEADRCKYFTATLYCQDQEAFTQLSKIISRSDFPTIEIFEEPQQLWSWDKLEEISKFNVTLVLGGPHCMVGKVMLAGHPELAEKVLSLLKNQLFGDKLYCAMVCEPWSKKWSNVVEIKYEDGTKDSLLSNDNVSTDRARRIKAIDLVDRSGHALIKYKSVGNTHFEVNKNIKNVTLHKGFLPLPGGDITLRINTFLKELSWKYFIPILATDYAYYAQKEDKIVQTMRLEGNNKIHSNLHMKTSEEIIDYLTGIMGLTPIESTNILNNNNKWASRFDNLTFKYEWRLAKTDGDPMKLAMDIIKKNDRMEWNNPVYVDRLREELMVIAKNPIKDLTPYFLPIHDVVNFYKENGQLVGPGRGSAGGSLFVYLLGITQINPFKYDLPFQRFFSLDRIMGKELPDIDCLEGSSIIKTDIGDITIEFLSTLTSSDYPKILTYNGNENIWETPELIFKKGNADIIEYILDNGSVLRCTKDHKVMTSEGWVQIDEAFEKGLDIKSIESDKQ